METTEKKSKKGIIIGIIAAIVAIAAVVIVLVLRNKDEAYRVIKVYELDGKTTVTRESKGDIEAYANMLLQSGDSVYVENGTTTLKLDEDKFVYAEAQTKFDLEATGTSANSKTTINLKQGAITNDIQNKLSDDSTYEINTENSNMSVRGTIYRVAVYEDEDGVKYTKLSVFSGSVATKLKDKDGNVSDKEVLIDRTKEVIVYEDSETIDYYTEVRDIDYSELPDEVIEFLIEKVENENLDIVITADELKEILNSKKTEEKKGPFTVIFMYNGAVFGTQEVEKNGYATVPNLMPTESGNWVYDFTKPITDDTVIEWK